MHSVLKLTTVILALNKNLLIFSLFLKLLPIRSVVSSCKCQKDLATLNIICSSHWQKCALLLFLKILYPSTYENMDRIELLNNL